MLNEPPAATVHALKTRPTMTESTGAPPGPEPRTRKSRRTSRSRQIGLTLAFTLTLAACVVPAVLATAASASSTLFDGGGSSTSAVDECTHPPATHPDPCAFVRAHCTDADDGLVNYLHWYYCGVAAPWRVPSVVLLLGWLVLLFATLGTAASEFFCPNLSTIAQHFEMSESLAGVTLLAFGNGSPDLVSTFSALTSGAGGLALGELVGAAAFITTMVLGCVAYIAPFTLNKAAFLRDGLFFVGSLILILIVAFDHAITLAESIALMAYYALYVAVVVAGEWWTARRHRQRRAAKAAHALLVDSGDNSDDDDLGAPLIPPALTIEPNDNESDVEEDELNDAMSTSPSVRSHILHRLQHQPHHRFSLLEAVDLADQAGDRPRSLHSYYPRSTRSYGPRSSHSGMSSPRRSPSRFSTRTGDVTDTVELVRTPSGHLRPPTLLPDRSSTPALVPPPPLIIPTNWTVAETVQSPSLLATPSAYDEIEDEIGDRADMGAGDLLFPLRVALRRPTSGWIERAVLLALAPMYAVLRVSVPVLAPDAPTNFGAEVRHRGICVAQNVLGSIVAGLVMADGLEYAGSRVVLAAVLGGIACIVTAAGLALNPAMHFTRFTYCWFGFVVGMVWIYLTANEIVGLLKALSVIFNISNSVMGLTVFAAGNSLGDFVANVTMAKMGFPAMAISACFASPMLNMVLGIGISSAYMTLHQGTPGARLQLNDVGASIVAALLGLLVIMVVMLIVVPLARFKVGKALGAMLVVLYAVVAGVAVSLS
ncbi:hypothetical protein AMAG_16197 [Allomyces macrogynus ATCC 38327]|uniref:Sodium/calcium exchanger membrane region domain-containing protein n=1 Tax=Allomyces macrogynus (strain ATCC 38327) TaxID=578462 RepID=A0A0L0TAR6_ALLM3|nr:hypothetical protein AMAG_16197 [Allomyces macrogynus ATCC 38327]|eukprot:KNE71639.1 hypothetical protein AMAG_16197 [Allomyces macrogynus ATCC 38327]